MKATEWEEGQPTDGLDTADFEMLCDEPWMQDNDGHLLHNGCGCPDQLTDAYWRLVKPGVYGPHQRPFMLGWESDAAFAAYEAYPR